MTKNWDISFKKCNLLFFFWRGGEEVKWWNLRHIIDINTTCYPFFTWQAHLKTSGGSTLDVHFAYSIIASQNDETFLSLDTLKNDYVLSYRHITHKLFQWQSVNIPAQIRCKACAFLAMTLTQVWPWLATTSTTRFSVRPSMEKGDRICTTPGAL